MLDGRGSWCKDCLNEHKRYIYSLTKTEILLQRKIERAKDPVAARAREQKQRRSNPNRAKGIILQKYWPGKTWQEALAIFNAMVLERNNLCDICGRPETCKSKKGSLKLIRDLCVDHCHTTGRVRGLLCDSCNVLLSKAKDSPIICISAAGYLKRALHDAIS
jgi:Recombination endonuclease VII